MAAAVVTGRCVRTSGEAASYTGGPAAGRRLRHAAAHIRGVNWPRPAAVLHWAQYLLRQVRLLTIAIHALCLGRQRDLFSSDSMLRLFQLPHLC